ncbi:MAG: prephenate dehydrogenase dimerization domain-containing protein, partial [Wenzhouxiangellaceae bacterium]
DGDGISGRPNRVWSAEHDRLMAWVLGLSHALNLMFAATLSNASDGEEAGVERLASISSTTFQRQLDLATAVTGENPNLYFEIQHLNPNQEAVLGALAGTLDAVRAAIEGGDEQAFVALMERARDWARRHRDAAGAGSDR